MISEKRQDVFHSLDLLGLHYPSMRIGQLLEFACAMAGEEEPKRIAETTDAEVVEAIRRHLQDKHPGGRGAEIGDGFLSLTEVRGKLADLLSNLGDEYPDQSIGQIVLKLALLAHVNVYDVEEQELIDAASEPGLGWFRHYENRLAKVATIREYDDSIPYSCPCCRNTTLPSRGRFDICPVCYWADDGLENYADCEIGGPNGDLSLTQARLNFDLLGACDAKFLDHVRTARPEEICRNEELETNANHL